MCECVECSHVTMSLTNSPKMSINVNPASEVIPLLSTMHSSGGMPLAVVERIKINIMVKATLLQEC